MKHIGGRGKKASYETTHVRIPIDIKPQVEDLVEKFRNNEHGSLEIVDNTLTDDSLDKSRKFVKLIIEEFKNNNLFIIDNSSNNSTQSLSLTLEEAISLSTELLSKRITKKELVNKLLTALYQVEINLD